MMKKLLLPLLITVVSLTVDAQQSYYNDVNLNLNGTALRDELATKITNTHTNTLSYSEAREALKTADLEPGQSTNVLLLYGFSNNTCQTNSSDDNDHRLRSRNSFGGGSTCEWNREHTYPKSLGTPNLGTSGPGADAHHLRATDVQRNSSRGSKRFATGSGNSGSSNGGWYPGDEWKGDVARMMMYMYLRYGNRCLPNNVAIGSTNSVDSNMINLLLEWNAQDPVSAYEDQRNEYLGNTSNQYGQGNRNPFIDNPYLATRIWGGTPAEDRWNGNSGSNDTQAPTIPSSVTASNETSNSVDLTWTPSTDDTAVTQYEVFVDGSLNTTTSTTNTTISGLNSETQYSFTVRAKDAAGNTSAFSNAVLATTLAGNNNGNTGTNCGDESFDNVPTNGASSYTTRTWTGNDGVNWTATDARTDQNLNGKAITVRNGTLTTSIVSGGVASFTVTTKRVFSGGSGTFDLVINGNKVGEIPYGSNEETTTINNINALGNNATGDVTVTLEKNTSTSNRVIFDDLSWTCYSTASTNQFNLDKVKVYPNPSSIGKVFIKTPSDVKVNSIKVFSILGKEVYKKNLGKNESKDIEVSTLSTGIYLVKISNGKQSITKKLIIQ